LNFLKKYYDGHAQVNRLFFIINYKTQLIINYKTKKN